MTKLTHNWQGKKTGSVPWLHHSSHNVSCWHLVQGHSIWQWGSASINTENGVVSCQAICSAKLLPRLNNYTSLRSQVALGPRLLNSSRCLWTIRCTINLKFGSHALPTPQPVWSGVLTEEEGHNGTSTDIQQNNKGNPIPDCESLSWSKIDLQICLLQRLDSDSAASAQVQRTWGAVGEDQRLECPYHIATGNWHVATGMI